MRKKGDRLFTILERNQGEAKDANTTTRGEGHGCITPTTPALHHTNPAAIDRPDGALASDRYLCPPGHHRATQATQARGELSPSVSRRSADGGQSPTCLRLWA